MTLKTFVSFLALASAISAQEPGPCAGQQNNLYILIDRSGSLKDSDMIAQRGILHSIVDQLDWDNENTWCTIEAASDNIKTYWTWAKSYPLIKSVINDDISNYSDGGSYPGEALRVAYNNIFSQLPPSRKAVPTRVVILSDGINDESSFRYNLDKIRSDYNAQVFIISLKQKLRFSQISSATRPKAAYSYDIRYSDGGGLYSSTKQSMLGEDIGSKICKTASICGCDNGVPAEKDTCSTVGTKHCQSCDPYYEINEDTNNCISGPVTVMETISMPGKIKTSLTNNVDFWLKYLFNVFTESSFRNVLNVTVAQFADSDGYRECTFDLSVSVPTTTANDTVWHTGEYLKSWDKLFSENAVHLELRGFKDVETLYNDALIPPQILKNKLYEEWKAAEWTAYLASVEFQTSVQEEKDKLMAIHKVHQEMVAWYDYVPVWMHAIRDGATFKNKVAEEKAKWMAEEKVAFCAGV